MATPVFPLLKQLRTELRAAGDPAKSLGMQTYMKSQMPYHGVQTPVSRPLFRKLLAPVEFANASEWRQSVRAIWDGAQYREERYGALYLCKTKHARPFQTPGSLPLYRHLITTGAWWDYVDDIASHSVGPLVKTFPDVMKPTMRKWSRDKDLWVRRTSILCQLSFKNETDLELLFACIEPSLGSKEFFLNKAIGWALRQLAWKQPRTVLKYVKDNEDRLHPLSRREALKNITRKKVKP